VAYRLGTFRINYIHTIGGFRAPILDVAIFVKQITSFLTFAYSVVSVEFG
jgi:hypothetical protein